MPIGVYKRSEEHKRKIGLVHKGKKLSEECKRKISEGTKKAMLDPQIREKISKASKGRKLSETAKKHLSELYKGSKSSWWKGGTSTFRDRVRNHPKYVQWRQSIFLRDDFTCQECGERGGILQAHHKKSFSTLLQEVRENLPLIDLYEAVMIYSPFWDLSNGQTLCKECHKKTKNYGGRNKLK